MPRTGFIVDEATAYSEIIISEYPPRDGWWRLICKSTSRGPPSRGFQSEPSPPYQLPLRSDRLEEHFERAAELASEIPLEAIDYPRSIPFKTILTIQTRYPAGARGESTGRNFDGDFFQSLKLRVTQGDFEAAVGS